MGYLLKDQIFRVSYSAVHQLQLWNMCILSMFSIIYFVPAWIKRCFWLKSLEMFFLKIEKFQAFIVLYTKWTMPAFLYLIFFTVPNAQHMGLNNYAFQQLDIKSHLSAHCYWFRSTGLRNCSPVKLVGLLWARHIPLTLIDIWSIEICII